ncbi:MAG: ATP-binding protein [Thermodesulfobacteriota bacterium]
MVDMERALAKPILDDLTKKIILITGPRQTGKTTLAKMLSDRYDYLNYDNADHRIHLLRKTWDRARDVIIFDELHKLKNWKSWLKGIFDTEGIPPALVVTGSAKLDTARKVGDSLAGRFFQFRLHPLDLKEIRVSLHSDNPAADLDALLNLGGFPEPFLNGTERFYHRWKKSHLDIILKQDLPEMENVQQILAVETLIQLLKRNVGTPVSYSSLARDLQCSDKTIKRWLTILENMYVVFRVPPYHKNIARAILKSPKYYFYDNGQVDGDPGAKLENLVACALHKEIHFQADCLGEDLKLHYLRNKDGREIDFLVTRGGVSSLMIEAKWREEQLSPNFSIFEKNLAKPRKIQLVKELSREKTYPDGGEVRRACDWLARLPL